MAGIRFDLPQQNAQKGPTCWYYSLKVLMKFHGLIMPPNVNPIGPNLFPQWRMLHRIRQSITDLSAQQVNYDAPSTISMNLYGKIRNSTDEVEKAELRSALGVMRNVANVVRVNFVQVTLGLQHIRQVNINPWNIDGLIATLTANGPFYISVNNAPRGSSLPKDDAYLFSDVPRRVQTYRVKATQFSGGPHAMVIFGAYSAPQILNHHSPDKERVYFWNPNDPRTFYYAAWDDISQFLNTPAPFTGNVIGIAVTCTPLDDCNHIANAVQLP